MGHSDVNVRYLFVSHYLNRKKMKLVNECIQYSLKVLEIRDSSSLFLPWENWFKQLLKYSCLVSIFKFHSPLFSDLYTTFKPYYIIIMLYLFNCDSNCIDKIVLIIEKLLIQPIHDQRLVGKCRTKCLIKIQMLAFSCRN